MTKYYKVPTTYILLDKNWTEYLGLYFNKYIRRLLFAIFALSSEGPIKAFQRNLPNFEYPKTVRTWSSLALIFIPLRIVSPISRFEISLRYLAKKFGNEACYETSVCLN